MGCPNCGAPGGGLAGCGGCGLGRDPDVGRGTWNTGQTKSQQYESQSTSGRRGSGCFPATARVRTPQGWQEMGAITVGDTVLSYDAESGRTRARTVTKKLEYSPRTLWSIELSLSTSPILTTKTHRFLTQRGWIQAGKLRQGDHVVMVNETFATDVQEVRSVQRLPKQEKVYNLYTAGEHTYVVEGCVVHNFSVLRQLRTWWHRTFLDPQEVVPGSVLASIKGI
ncbi:MAG: Hint domain-containing protein [Nitrospira sp.]|nr:hypothetical protein [Nitrospira sp.]